MIEGRSLDGTNNKLTYGMVGGGPGSFIGPVHRAAIALNGQARIVAGSFSNIVEEVYQTARELGIDEERTYETYQEMAEKEAEREDCIDFVSITVPNHIHFDVAKAFLEKGINVVCDKPLCFTEEQSKILMDLANKNNVDFMVTYSYTGYPMIREAKELVKSGKLGKIRVVVAEYPQDWLADRAEDQGNRQAEWRTDPKFSGISNCVGDIGTHIENLVHFVTGLEIDEISAKLEKHVPGRVLDDNAYILLKFKGGATGNYWASQIAIGRENGLKIRVYGTEGSIEWEQEHPNFLKYVEKGGTVQIMSRGSGYLNPATQSFIRLPAGHPEGYLEAFSNLYKLYCEKLIEGKSGKSVEVKFPTVIDGARGVKFVHDCVKSSEDNNKWVDGSFNN
jgi:predicted dehydrogenase